MNFRRGYDRCRACLAVCLFTLSVSACTAAVDLQGNQPDPQQLGQIKPGSTTRNQVLELLGTPSTAMTFGDESWQYISARTETVAFFKPEVKDRQVVSISFDPQGVVKEVLTRGLTDGQNVTMVARQTPTVGKDLSILEQLLGNVGRFSKDTPGSSK